MKVADLGLRIVEKFFVQNSNLFTLVVYTVWD